MHGRDQYLIVINLHSILTNKILVTGFMTVKVSLNLNPMQKLS